MAFTEVNSGGAKYRCSGIHAIHTCETDPHTWDRYSQYRTQDATIRKQAADLMATGIRAGQVAAYLNSQSNSRIRANDVHRIMQTNRDKMRSLGDYGLTPNESQRLLDEIGKNGDQYRVKFRDNTEVMDCIFYWDPMDVQLARRFSQVLQIDTTWKDNAWKYPLLEITATTNEMNTFVIAQALVQSESAETLLWVLEQVQIQDPFNH